MEKIYALIDKDGLVVNTILLDIDNSTWTCPEGLALQESSIGIGDNIDNWIE